MVKSLLQRNEACYICGTTLNLHLHHIFYGTANYDANKEHINVTKLKLRILEAQLSREWGAAGKGDI